jgi:autotransporter-associated beta strand protein
MYRSLVTVLATAAVLLARADRAHAQTFNWVGNTDANWLTGANWNPLGPPASGSSTVLTFDAPAVTFSDLNNDIVGLTIDRLTFGSAAPISYTLSGNAITIGGSNNRIQTTSSVLQTINLAILTSTAVSITNTGTAVGTDLQLNGSITLGPSAGALSFRGTGDTVAAGVISGVGGVTKADSGTLVLGGANTFTGALTINQGSVTITSGGSIFTGSLTAGAIIMGRGTGVSQLTLTSGAITTTGVSLSFGGTGADGTTQSTVNLGTYGASTDVLFLGGNITYSGAGNPLGALITGANANIVNAATRTWDVKDSTATTNELTVLAPITGAGGITKTGTGNLVLGGVNTFTGNLTVNQGSVTITSGGVLYSGNATAAAIVMSRGQGTARVTLTAGSITGTGVSIAIGGSGANTTSQSTIDLGSYATLTTVLNLGGTVTYSSTGNPQGAVITGNNAQIALFGAGSSGGRTFNIADSTSAADDMTILVPIINGVVTGSITKTGGGTLVFGASNSYTGGTSIQQGAIVGSVTNALPTGQTINLAVSSGGAASLELRGAIAQTIGGLTIYNSSSAANSAGTVTLGSAGQFTLNGNLTVSNGNNPLQARITGSGTSVFTVTGVRTFNVLDSTANAVDLLIDAPSMVITNTGIVRTGSGVMQISSALSGAGSWDVRNGTTILSGDSTFSGITTLRGGELVLDFSGSAAGSRFGTSAPLVLQGGTLRMIGNASADVTQTIANVTLGAAFDPLLVNVVGQATRLTTLELTNVTRGVGASSLDLRTSGTGDARYLTSSGTAGQVLQFATLDGGFATREAGGGSTRIVAFTDYDAKSDLRTVVSGDDLSSPVEYTNYFIRSADLNSWLFNSPTTFGQSADLAGASVSSQAGFVVGPGVGSQHQTIFNGILRGNSNGELLLNVTNTGTGELRIQSNITDTTSITKAGPGTVELRGNNDFIGGLFVNDGIVRVAATTGTNGRSVGDTALVTVGGGSFRIADGVTERIGGLASPISLSNGDVTLGANSTLILNMTATPAQHFTGAYVGPSTSTIIKDNVGTWTVNQDNNSGFTGSVIVNRGLLVMSGTGVSGGLRDAASFTINQDAGLILDDNGNSAARTRISATAAVTLNGARGTFGTGIPSGILHRASDNRNEAEVIGSLTLGGGSSYIRFDNQGASNEPSTRSGISVAGALTRNNNATLSVRGVFLGYDGDGTVGGTGSRTRLYFGTTDTASTTGIGTAPAEFGTGTDNGVTRRIIPYIVAEFVGTPGAAGNATGTTVGAANLGNAFATYSDASDTSGAGLRALVIDPAQVQNGSVAETTTFAASTSADDNIRENLTAGLNVVGSPTVQSLVVHNNSSSTNVSLTGGGAGAVLTVNSGGFLFTGSSRGITLTNFGGGIAVNNSAYLTGNGLGTRHEYIVHAMNTSTTGAVFGSSLVTANADFTKSGAGKLTFTTGVTNLFQGLVTINEGILEVSENAHLGDNSAASNDLRLAGGTFRIAGTGFTTNNRDLELLAGTLSQIELTGAAAHRITGNVTGGGGLRVNTTGTGTGLALQLGTVGAAFTMGTGGETSDLIIGRGSATAGAGELDLSASSSVSLNLDEVLIGDGDTLGTAGTGRGVLRLSTSGSNTVTARRIVVSDNASADNNGSGVQSAIVFGSGANTLNADSITVGGRKGNGILALTPGSSLTINGRGGNGTLADLYIGDNASGTAFFNTGIIDATGVTVAWNLNNLVIGRHGSLAGSGQGTLTFNQGTIEARTIMLGRTDYLGDSTNDANTTATINVNVGAHLKFDNLRKGNGTAVVNLAGTLGSRTFENAVIENVQINVIGTSAAFDASFGDITLQAGASVVGTGGLLKGGFGTLYLDGAMTYAGASTIDLGVVVLGGHDRFPVTTTLFVGDFPGTALDMHGFNQTLTELNGSGPITNSGGGNSLLTVSQGAFSGTISDGTGLVSVLKTGSGTLVLGGNSSFSSTMTVAGGTLQIGGNGTTGMVVANIVNTSALVLSRTDLAIYTGVISGAGTVTATGNGSFALSGANQYTGATIISLGALRAIDGVGLPTGSNLQLNGGTFESSGTFDRTFGTGADQVQWTGSGGFSAAGGNLTVLLGGDAGPITWGAPGFVGPVGNLLFGSTQADSRTIVVNAINLSAAIRTIGVADNGALTTDVAELSGVVSNGGLIKTGAGTLVLSAVNTYAAGTTIAGGILRAVEGTGLPTTGNLTITGGVLESSGTFTRALGTGAGQVRFTGTGGFSAFGGDLTVNLGGAGATVTRGTAPFATSTLVFGSTAADARTLFVNGVNLNAGTLVVDVRDNPTDNTDLAEMSGAISNGSLTKIGLGTLILSGVNTFGGTVAVDEGVLQAVDGVGLPSTANLLFTGPTFGSVPAIFQSSGSFTRSLGAGPGQVQWGFTCRGGFAAFGGDLTVNIGGAGAEMLFNQNLFSGSFANSELQFGSSTATHRTIFVNAINFNNGTRSVFTFDNPDSQNDVAELAGVLSNGGLAKGGDGTLIVSANNTYVGATQVNGGTLVIAPTGHINGNGGVTVQAGTGLRVDAGGSITGGTISTTGSLVVNGSVTSTITVRSGGTLSGGGTIAAYTLQSGSTLSPGNSVGELEVSSGTATWNGGATIKFEFIDALGSVPGDDWDYLNMSASVLQINASASNKITLLIDSWKADNTGHGGGVGPDHNGFDPMSNYSWLFASTAGLSPNLNTSQLQALFNVVDNTPGAGVFGAGNPYTTIGGTFTIGRISNDLYINYTVTAIPEPSSVILSTLAAAGMGWRVRRRRKAAAPAPADTAPSSVEPPPSMV